MSIYREYPNPQICVACARMAAIEEVEKWINEYYFQYDSSMFYDELVYKLREMKGPNYHVHPGDRRGSVA